jgi:hypothetical protein
MCLSPAAPVPRGETESAIPAMCNRIRGLKEWGEIPRSLTYNASIAAPKKNYPVAEDGFLPLPVS